MSTTDVRKILDRQYTTADYPALDWQARQWDRTRPFDGLRVLDATPVFGNTLAKYVPLLAAGAHVSVALSPLLPHGREFSALLPELGIPVVESPSGTYDVVMDCAGVLAHVGSRSGYVELTKTGQHVYAHCPKPVLLADDSRIKHIETSLGTGDGFLRGLAHFGHPDVSGRTIVVFGGGKVGRGAAMSAREAGADVTVVDPAVPGGTAPSTFDGVWCVVSATGISGALAPLTQQLRDSTAILANLGAEDEFGPAMPADRVLNAKAPVNFALPEPTRLRYLDATFALVNACALALLTERFPAGISPPPRAVEDAILAVVATSTIGPELPRIHEELL